MRLDRKAASAAIVVAMLFFGCAGNAPGGQQASVGRQQTRDIAIDAYIYGYPLVTSEITRMATTNTVAINPKTLQAPLGQVISLPGYPPPTYRGVTAPNADTLYTFGFIDVSKEPWVFSYPDMGSRYFLFPIYDEWTNIIGSPGTRTYGGKGQSIAITGPGWTGKLPSGVSHELKSPTGMVFIIGRVYAQNTPADLAAVHALQRQFKWIPANSFGKPFTPAPGQTGGPYTPAQKVRSVIDAMSTTEYFNFLAKAMAVNPPIMPQDAAIVSEMAKIGLVPGQPFDMTKLSSDDQAALSDVGSAAFQRIQEKWKTAGKENNGWVTLTGGTYGANYLMRAAISAFGWGANLPDDAIYPSTKVDGSGKPLVGANAYKLHFAKAETPPAKAFWSITMYDSEYFFYPNSLNKQTLSPRDNPVSNPDGSLDLYFANVQPANVPKANWLPAPPGQFVLMMRVYWPNPAQPSMLPPNDPTWVPPPVTLMK